MKLIPPTKRFAWLLTVILAGIQLPWAQAGAAEQAPVRVGYIEFPPYSYTDAQGQPAGHLLEFFELVAQRAGYRTQFIEYPSYRLFKTMESGLVDMRYCSICTTRINRHRRDSKNCAMRGSC